MFVDDSLENVIEARADGYDARWAGWGYSNADQRIKADRLGIEALQLGDIADAVGSQQIA
jgi:hypothetical protein